MEALSTLVVVMFSFFFTAISSSFVGAATATIDYVLLPAEVTFTASFLALSGFAATTTAGVSSELSLSTVNDLTLSLGFYAALTEVSSADCTTPFPSPVLSLTGVCAFS